MARQSPSKFALLPRNPLFRLLVIHGVSGALLGILFVAGLLMLDVAGIHSLLSRSGEWVVVLALLTTGSVVTFSSVSMGGAIMLLPKEEAPRAPPSRGAGELVPAMVAALGKSRQAGDSRLLAD